MKFDGGNIGELSFTSFSWILTSEVAQLLPAANIMSKSYQSTNDLSFGYLTENMFAVVVARVDGNGKRLWMVFEIQYGVGFDGNIAGARVDYKLIESLGGERCK